MGAFSLFARIFFRKPAIDPIVTSLGPSLFETHLADVTVYTFSRR